MPTTIAALGLVITAVIVWYLAEWRHCQEQRQSMNLVRNPLGLLWLAIQRLWRNRRFVGILICCWLASVGVYRFVIDPLVLTPAREKFGAAMAAEGLLPGPAIEESEATVFRGRAVTLDNSGFIGYGPTGFVWRSLPRFRQVNLRLAGTWWGIIDVLALGVVAVGLTLLWFRRPIWLPSELRQQVVWPIYLTLSGFLIAAAYTGCELAAALSGHLLFESGISSVSLVYYSLWPLLLAFAIAVLSAVLWHIVLQVGSGQHGNLHHAITGAINNWLPIAWLLLFLYLPFSVAGLITALLPTSLFMFIHHIENITVVPSVLRIILLFVPWIILAEGANLGTAIKRNFQLIGKHWWDLLVFLPRYLLIVIPVYAALDALGWPTIRNSAVLTSLSFARSLVELVLLVAIVVLYLELRKGEKAQPERQEVDCCRDGPTRKSI